MKNIINSSGFIIGFFGFGIYTAIDTHIRLYRLRKQILENKK